MKIHIVHGSQYCSVVINQETLEPECYEVRHLCVRHLCDLAMLAAWNGRDWWTIDKQAHPGDRVVFYIRRPLSCLVAIGTVISPPRRQTDPSKGWPGRYIADIADVQLLSRPIPVQEIRQRFPNWAYWRQPRAHICVPPQFAMEFWKYVLSHL
jgi:hypothetical protein